MTIEQVAGRFSGVTNPAGVAAFKSQQSAVRLALVVSELSLQLPRLRPQTSRKEGTERGSG
jgi:hypothetical protein